MGGKQMEGDEDMKRKRARDARRAGMSASEAGVTTGGSKQRSQAAGSDDHEERLAHTQRGEQKSSGDDVPRPLRGKGRRNEPRVGSASDLP